MLSSFIRSMLIGGLMILGLRGVFYKLPFVPFLVVLLCFAAGFALPYLICEFGSRRKLGELAKKRGWLTEEGVEKILSLQKEKSGMFGEIARTERFLTPSQVEALLTLQLLD